MMLKSAPRADKFWVIFYTITGITKDIPKNIVKNEIRKGSNNVESHINPIKLVYTDDINKATIVHQFGGVAPFPFSQDSLAYVPSSGMDQYTIFYRPDEDDFVQRETTHELDIVAEHELFHIFGISHNEKEPESIMAPRYSRWNYATIFDISQIREKVREAIIRVSDVSVLKRKLLTIIRRDKKKIADALREKFIDKILDLYWVEYPASETKENKIDLFCDFVENEQR